MKKILALPMLLALVGGCAPIPYWTLTDDDNRVLKSTSFEMTVPAGWTRTTTADTWERVTIDDKPQTLLLELATASRDGVGIQAITVTRRYPDTAFPTIKKKSSAKMLPLEAADLYVSELRKRNGLERRRLDAQGLQPRQLATGNVGHAHRQHVVARHQRRPGRPFHQRRLQPAQ